jgi:acyl carrier protein
MLVESRDSVVKELTRYIQDELLSGDRSAELTTETPLLRWGILNSIDTARLVGFIRERFGVRIPPADIVEKNFRDIGCIADLVASLSGSEATNDR